MERYNQLKRGEKGAWLSIVTYVILSGVKLVIGYMFLSQALIADGLNNATDIIASLAVLIGLRISQKPPDANHPYGHFRAENIASLIAAFIMAAVGLQVLVEAGRNLVTSSTESPDMITAWVALICAIIMFAVYRYNKKLAKQVNSQALAAVAADNRSDALVSLGAMIGILASQWNLAWIDTLTALIIGLLICYTAFDIFRQATHSLTDGFHERDLHEYKASIEVLENVEALKVVKARQVGSSIYADVVIEVSPDLNVRDSHLIADQVEEVMRTEHRIENTHVHVEPSEEEKLKS
ncbi:cation diffusion facilitator family transporter [Alkalicoccobacillus murimartini]|uniref:Cation diffusion facilitator family transporter n=1 Tax=Alkalicoccobacillus murimartini TaxID=171685 RepID=A0ABT9YFW8_9BACI|nr:cation diffusion facilitator family transporter [Alkalicoccobacillus murimartini]MDQ0206112.1 cation diffusion facilitator family transporter [Alkalicoccobacillus murimartini]